jgi:hypothetical protein
MEENKEQTQEEKEKKDLLEQIIFNGYAVKIIDRFKKHWGFKTLNRQEHARVWSISTIVDDDATSWLNFKITVIKTALVSINNIEIDEDSKEELFHKLPTQIVDELFSEYQKLDKMQLEAIDNLEQIKDMSKDFFSRVRFKVMKASGALPTEDRVKKMNDHQWFYYYYQLLEDEKEEEERLKHKMDYMAFYMNPELAMKVREQEDSAKNGTLKPNNVDRTKAHEEINPNNPNQIISYKDTTVDDDFDKKMKMFMNENEITELSDDVRKGDATESKEDFLSRAIANTKVADSENEKILNSINKDAQKAGVNPEDLDAIEIK